MAHKRRSRYIRKLIKQSRYSYAVTLPKALLTRLHWRERQRLAIRLFGKGLVIRKAGR
ncbi:MAG: AbrB/MazE/SpoVT family DNA-binding domain-containing protein [Candidatus Methylomirabilales bacterium]